MCINTPRRDKIATPFTIKYMYSTYNLLRPGIHRLAIQRHVQKAVRWQLTIPKETVSDIRRKGGAQGVGDFWPLLILITLPYFSTK